MRPDKNWYRGLQTGSKRQARPLGFWPRNVNGEPWGHFASCGWELSWKGRCPRAGDVLEPGQVELKS